MSSTPEHTWFKIAENIAEINFSANGLAEVEVNGKIICVGRFGNDLFSCTQKCPHAGGILANGYVDAVGNIVCPLHKYKYSVKTGRNISGEGYFLKTFPVELRQEGIFIQVTANNLF